MRASEIADVVGGDLVGPDVEVEGATIDTRELRGGELFVPVVGTRDGHLFIEAAIEGGAAAYLSSRPPVGGTAIVVDDAAAALTELGSVARARLPDRVVGITGSVGKTTTKDLVASALGMLYRTHASVRSFNNELGVPLTLLNAPDDTEVAVIELGARGRGHIAELCEVARPTVGVVTAVERVHTELFGDLDDVAEAKSELVQGLESSGFAVLNADNMRVAAMAERTDAQVVLFGLDEGEIRAEALRVDDELRPQFRLSTPWGSGEVKLGVRGVHNVANALAAAGAALVCGVDLAKVVAGLEEATASPWRMELGRTPAGAIVLNDAYNAGPASTAAALRALAHLDATRRFAVLGPMAELGSHAVEEHRRIARLADELQITLITVGAPDYGAHDVADLDEAATVLGPLGERDAVLVKGSRVAGLEELAHRLLSAE
jgi:UDP-N-acetylmuramoyl-tripeptide--D-alanyl-D-alanine ligase